MKECRTGSGRHIRVGSILGKGGEGTVFHVDGDNDIAAKIYTDGKQRERKDKISAMVADGFHKRSTFVAFPLDTMLGDRGDFIGFTMRKVVGVKPIHELYGPGSRKIEFPRADFRFLARAATNVARAIASVHQTGCVIGDINHSGILVGNQGTVTLIDADSFQVRSGARVFRCRVGVGEYTPPEIQGAALDQVDREPSHDAFGLAVIIFQLLFMGRHPFAGRYAGQGDMPIERAIKEGRFAYSVQRKQETRMDPPPFVPRLSDVTPELASAFERAFPSNPGFYRSRPSAADWVGILNRFEAELTTCRGNAAHHHPKNAPSCPWCRLENGMRTTLFPTAGTQVSISERRNFDLNAAIAAIDRILSPGELPDPDQFIPSVIGISKSQAAQEIWRSRMMRRFGGLALAALCVILMVNGLSAAFLGLILAGFMVFGGGDARQPLYAAKVRAEAYWNDVLNEWEMEAGPGRFERKRAELRKLVSEYRNLPALERNRLEELNRRKEETQRQRFLEGHLIARAKISGIGEGRKATLASYGIEDAWDVMYHKICAVPGFGDVMATNLVAWREAIERKFVFNPSLGIDSAAIQRVRDGVARRAIEIEQALARGPIELEELRTQLLSARNRPPQRLFEAHRALRQAQFDLT